ncbi:MAG: PUA domain-containing protein [Thermosphaera aggregans]
MEEESLKMLGGMLNELRRVYGSLTQRLVESLATPPRRLYIRVNTLRATVEEVLEEMGKEGVRARKDEEVDEAVYVELEGPFKLPGDIDKAFIVDEKTAASVMMGSNLYRPGVLKADSVRRGELVKVVSKHGFYVGVVEATMSSSELFRVSKGLIGVNIVSVYRAPKINELSVYRKGLIYPQGLPAMVTTLFLNPREGDLVADLNASPGGKTGHVVQYTKGKSRVIAFDRNTPKIEVLKTNLERLGLNINVLAIPYDSRYAHLDFNLNERVDRVLIDPPCSNLGVRPKLTFDKTLMDILNNANYQKQFLKTAYRILKKGGVAVYSTCTLTLRENEEVVSYAVKELGFESIEADSRFSRLDKVYFEDIVGYRFHPLNGDMPGYFIALLKKP